jgi:muramoyltetrapeptide carboxypeptidase
MRMIRPPVLQSDHTIGIIAPGEYSHNRSEVQIGRALLEMMGFQVVLGQNVFERYGYLAGTDAQRAADFNRMWQDDSVQAILCWGEIWGSARILSYVDYDAVRAHPKVFLGRGNTTALHLAILKKTRLITFHGPSFASFHSSTYTRQAFLRALTSTDALGSVGQPPQADAFEVSYPPVVSLVPGKATGPLVGGNLAAVAATLGTPYEIETEGRILFLEARDDAPEFIERDLTTLGVAGKLKAAAGIVIGECVNCKRKDHLNKANEFSLEEVLEDRLCRLSVPSLYGLRIGQGRDMAVLPLGVEATLDSATKTLTVEEPAAR